MASMKYDFPLLDRNTSFSTWQFKMKAVLTLLDLEETLLGLEKMPSTWTTEEKQMKDWEAMSQIHLYLSDEILRCVRKEKSAAKLWLKLEQWLMPNRLHLKLKLFSYRMTEGTSLQDHISTFKEIVADLKYLEIEYQDEDLVLFLLRSLPSSYSTFKDMVLYSGKTITLDSVVDALVTKEMMRHRVSNTKKKINYSSRILNK